MNRIRRSEKCESPGGSLAVQQEERHFRGRELMSMLIVAQTTPLVSYLLPDLTPTARRILWPGIVAVHRIALHNHTRANRLLAALIRAADKPSFAEASHENK